MEIKLRKLILRNFKGIKFLEIDLSDITNIYGANATGKTTVFDAFTWLLFNKDSEGNTAFEVKTLDKNNRVIDKLEHSVEACIEVDGFLINITKLHVQKWVKKKGATAETLEGSENSYYWNNVPLKEKEYQEKIKEIIEPELFTLITNPNKFNNLNWKDRRNILFQISGNITDAEIINNNPKLTYLLQVLQSKTLDEYKKEVSAKISKLKKDMESISPRIDEVFNSITEVEPPAPLNPIKARLAEVNAILMDSQKAFDEFHRGQLAIKSRIALLEGQILDIKNKRSRDLKALEAGKQDSILSIENSIKSTRQAIKNLSESKEYNNAIIISNNEALEKLRAEAIAAKTKIFVFNKENCACPTCKRKLEAEDIEAKKQELEANFNARKAGEVETITGQGLRLKEKISKSQAVVEQINKEADTLNQKLLRLNTELEAAKSEVVELEPDDSTINIQSELEALKATLLPYSPDETDSQKHKLLSEKEALQLQLEQVQKRQLIMESNRKAKERIAELERQAEETAQTIAELEGQEFLLQEFTRDKITYTEEKINGLFKMAKFKMFHRQVNGGISECCETMYNGVPYGDLNNAARMNVGLDIINALTGYYNVTAPIFIDNRESVTEIIETDSQIVNLIVSDIDKNLRIEGDQ